LFRDTDLPDLNSFWKQTEGKGVTIYTHGEMLRPTATRGSKNTGIFSGISAGRGRTRRKEFAAFPGAILMTTNCIQEPQPGYKDRIFTTGLVEWPGVPHISALGGKKGLLARH